MNYLQTLKKIRLGRGIKNKDVLQNARSHSTYSKIENGSTELKINMLVDLLETFEVSMEEFIHMNEYNVGITYFMPTIRQACREPKNQKLKEIILSEFYPIKNNIKDMNKLEILYYCSIKNYFADHWPEITHMKKYEISHIVSILKKKEFYGQYDYTIVLNSMAYMTESQIDLLMESLFPIKDIEQRTAIIINTGFSILTNAITKNIYILDYKKAWKYVTLAEKLIPYTTGYFSKINLEYSKYIILRFLERDTIYIEKARQIIGTVKAIGDELTAKKMEEELNNLTEKADYYLDMNHYKSVPQSD